MTRDLRDDDFCKRSVLATLPNEGSDIALRSCDRSDLIVLSEWPEYPFPYQPFTLSCRGWNAEALDRVLRERINAPTRISLAADERNTSCIGFVSLMDIDWQSRSAGNMSIRVHPRHCSRGVGTRLLQQVRDWAFGSGFVSLRLDVAASNLRAVRCYEKAGFTVTCERWRGAPDLADVDLSAPAFAFLAPHVRNTDRAPELRFLVMRVENP